MCIHFGAVPGKVRKRGKSGRVEKCDVVPCVRHVTSGTDVEKKETKQPLGRHLHFAEAANLRPEVLRPVGAAGRADGEVVYLGNSPADQRQFDQASLTADDVAPNESLQGEGLAFTGGGGGGGGGAGSRDKWRHD